MPNLYRITPLEEDNVEYVINLDVLSINDTKLLEDSGPVKIEVVDKQHYSNTVGGK